MCQGHKPWWGGERIESLLLTAVCVTLDLSYDYAGKRRGGAKIINEMEQIYKWRVFPGLDMYSYADPVPSLTVAGNVMLYRATLSHG